MDRLSGEAKGWVRRRHSLAELERIITAINAARIALPAIVAEPQRAIAIERAAPLAYRKAQLPTQRGVLQEKRDTAILDLFKQVLAVEAPIHQGELTRRLTDAYSLKRMGVKSGIQNWRAI